MKDKVKLAKNKFLELYSTSIEKLGNHLSVGIGKDKNNNFIIAARLNNIKGKEILPTYFESFRVEIFIVGDIIAYTDKG